MRLAAALLLVVVLAPGASAQCPDGSMPPCRLPVLRSSNPPLDDQLWIVVPFDNLGRTRDAEWLREASVNLLYLDMSRWKNIRVVDDERVDDLIQQVPEARGAPTLSLNAALAVARRAGAGKLVMGDLLKAGSRTTVTAKVYTVRDGQRVRTLREDTVIPDSLWAAFGRLAKGVLNVTTEQMVSAGTIGTENTDAYKDYLEGVKALNRWDLVTGRRMLESALRTDSAFALAHYKLSILIGLDTPADTMSSAHANAASRFSATLPPRERSLIAGLRALYTGAYPQACATYGALVRADSSDIDALQGYGACHFGDRAVIRDPADSTRFRFRGSRNEALRAFRRALVADPSYHIAFSYILSMYSTVALAGPLEGSTPRTEYTTTVRRDADSLLLVPVLPSNFAAINAQADEARRTNVRLSNLQAAREIARQWVADAPNQPTALRALARLDLQLGDIDQAARGLASVRASDLPVSERVALFADKLDVAIKSGRDAEAVRILDSAFAAPQRPSWQVLQNTHTLLGRMTVPDSIVSNQLRGSTVPQSVPPYYRLALHSFLGMKSDSARIAERLFYQEMSARSTPNARIDAVARMARTLMFALRLPRTEWPPIDSLPDYRFAPAAALARRDTIALRAAAKMLDSASRAGAAQQLPDDGAALIAADAFLMLGDSLNALRMMRRMLDERMRVTPLTWNFAQGGPLAALIYGVPKLIEVLPRAFLLRADLEAAIGDKTVARSYYARVLALWAKADPEFQPTVARARAAFVAIGAR